MLFRKIYIIQGFLLVIIVSKALTQGPLPYPKIEILSPQPLEVVKDTVTISFKVDNPAMVKYYCIKVRGVLYVRSSATKWNTTSCKEGYRLIQCGVTDTLDRWVSKGIWVIVSNMVSQEPVELTYEWKDRNVLLRWEKNPELDWYDLLGYNIYRKESGNQIFEKINPSDSTYRTQFEGGLNQIANGIKAVDELTPEYNYPRIVLLFDPWAEVYVKYHTELTDSQKVDILSQVKSEIESKLFINKVGYNHIGGVPEAPPPPWPGYVLDHLLVFIAVKSSVLILPEYPDYDIDSTKSYDYTVTAVDMGCSESVFSEPVTVLPKAFSEVDISNTDANLLNTLILYQNHPNPFNSSTIIGYQLPVCSYVTLRIFNILGQRVKTLLDKQQEPGIYAAQWDGTSDEGNKIPTGLYFCKMEAFKNHKRFIKWRKLLIVR